MKGKFCLSIFALCTLILGNAIGQQERYTEFVPVQEIVHVQECIPTRADSFNYLKLGLGGSRAGVAPAIGLGRRMGLEGGALDISVNWTGSNKTGYFSLPKMLYLQYLTPNSPTSFYWGAGMSFGGIRNKNYHFSGLLAEGALGYEMNRDSNIKFFAEVDFSHGLVPFSSRHGHNGFSPALAFTVGAGF